MSLIKEHNETGQLCSGCKAFKTYSEFYRSKDKKTKYKSACKECQRSRMNAYYKTDKGRKVAQEKSWRDHGINGMTVELYEVMVAEQHGTCAICDATVNQNGTRLCVDHDHLTGETRGLLCHNCNTTLGRFNDDPHLLLKAVSYLEKYTIQKVKAA